MANRKHGQQVEDLLRKACKGDKARIQFARISRFGLLEMSRQRLHPSVRESTTENCPRCQGRGSIRTVDSMALQMLTRMEDWSEKGKRPTLIVQVPSDTGEYLMNNKRAIIARIEEAYDIQITLQIRQDLDIPHYRIERQWNENNQQRVEVLEDTGKRIKPPRPNRKLKPVKPVVGIPTPVPEAVVEEPKKTGPLQALINLFTGSKKREASKPVEKNEPPKDEQTNKRRRRGGRNRNRAGAAQKETSGINTDNKQQGSSSTQKQARKAAPKKSNQQQKQSDVKIKEAIVNDSAEGETTTTKPRRRRRRRRRPSGNNEETSTVQNNTPQQSNKQSKSTPSEDTPQAAKPTADKKDTPQAAKPTADKKDASKTVKQTSSTASTPVATSE